MRGAASKIKVLIPILFSEIAVASPAIPPPIIVVSFSIYNIYVVISNYPVFLNN